MAPWGGHRPGRGWHGAPLSSSTVRSLLRPPQLHRCQQHCPVPTPCLWVGWGIWAGGPRGTALRGSAMGSAWAQEEQGSFTAPSRNAALLVFLLQNRSSSSQSAAWLIPDDITFQLSHDLFIFFGSDCYKGGCVFFAKQL